MKVQYISSACLQIETSDTSILTDPWFSQGIFVGSWFSFPRIDPFDYIKEPDYIYISHIHPDHYDPDFIHQLFERFGKKPILIPDMEKNYLFYKGKSDGLDLTPIRSFKTGNTSLFIEENDTGSISDIDSALIVHDDLSHQSLLNLNDCVFNRSHAEKLQSIIHGFTDELDIIALGYTGASPYPQTYYDVDKERELLIQKADEKKQRGFDRYTYFTNFFNAKHHLPFAGEYLLGGSKVELNEFRGVADAFEVKGFDPKALVFHPGGGIDLNSGHTNLERNLGYSAAQISDRLSEISSTQMDYEQDLLIDFNKINFSRLMKTAALNAQKKSEIKSEYSFIFSITENDVIRKKFLFICSSETLNEISVNDQISADTYSEIIIDYRLLFGLITGLYHWDNADIGSAYLTRRKPHDNFDRSVLGFLNFFTAI
jgi:UDP-MurNAc hydroxylase